MRARLALGRAHLAEGPVVASEASRTSRVITVQYLRALAASLVVLHHTLNIPALAPYYTKPLGTFGVDLFFVISGYIMWTTTFAQQPGAVAFWTARIARVVPLYWIFTSVFIAAALAMPAAMQTAAIEPIHVLKSYFFIPAEHPRLGGALPTYTLGWTLNYEMFFYAIFGLCLFIPHRPVRLALLLGSLALLVLAGAVVQPQGVVAQTYTNPILLEFAAGSLLAWISPEGQGIRPAIGWAFIGFGALWLAIAYAHEVSTFAAHGVPAVAMLAGALMLEPLARASINPLGAFLGDASYSIYLAHPFGLRLWHLPFERLVGTGSVAGIALYVASAVVVGIAVGIASYLLVEKPILSALKRPRRRHGRGDQRDL